MKLYVYKTKKKKLYVYKSKNDLYMYKWCINNV